MTSPRNDQPPAHVVVVAGVARSGTSWLGQLFDSHPQVVYRFQPFFSYAFRDRMHADSDTTSWRTFFRDVVASDDPFLTQQARRASGEYPVFSKATPSTHLVFKTCRFQYLLPNLLRKCPETRLVAVVRHPCAVLDSWRHTPSEFPNGAEFQREWREASCKNQGKTSEFFGYYKWKEAAHLYLDLRDQLPERVDVVPYRMLVEQSRTVVPSLLKSAGLTYPEQTRSFLGACHRGHQDSPFAVFKDPNVVDQWKRNDFPKVVRDEIDADLRDTRLEAFLQ